MSHFTVLVAADDEEDLLKKLTPYYEYGCSTEMDKLVKPYLVFERKGEEFRKEYETGTATQAILEDGAHVWPWDAEKQKLTVVRSEEMPLSQIYPTFEEFVRDYHGARFDAEQGDYGYWHNPNAKWDWYSVGGRWSGCLTLKDGASADVAAMGEIDWPAMLASKLARARAYWTNWQKMIERVLPISEYLALEREAQRAVWEQLRQQIFPTEDRKLSDQYSEATFFEPKGSTLKEHLDHVRGDCPFFAFVDTQGVWHQSADMGWWGFTSNENETIGSEWTAFRDALAPEQTLWVTDCHI